MNYSELVSGIGDFLDRRDLQAVIPTFIKLCEASLFRDLRLLEMERRSRATVSSQFSALPDDFLEMRNIELPNSLIKSLQYLTPEQMDSCRTMNPFGNQPGYYTITANRLEIIPAPSEPIEIEIIYYARPEPLGVNNATNIVLRKAPDAYLYGSLIHAAPYLKDDERLAVWDSLHSKAIDQLIEADQRAKYRGSTLGIRVAPIG